MEIQMKKLLLMFMLVSPVFAQDTNWQTHQINQHDCEIYETASTVIAKQYNVPIDYVVNEIGTKADARTIFWCAKNAQSLDVRYFYDQLSKNESLMTHLIYFAPEHR